MPERSDRPDAATAGRIYASLYALAALSEADELMRVQQIQIGDMTLKRGGSTAAAACLRYQAELMMAPYLKDRFCFRSV